MNHRQGKHHQKILDAAAAVFAEEGFAGARVDEIARRAQINKAMLYYHVGDKTTLYQAVLKRNFDLLAEKIDAITDEKAEPKEQLRAFIQALVSALDELAYHPRIMMRELASGGANMTPEVFAKLLSIYDRLNSILDRGAKNGQFRPTSPLLTHLSIVASAVMTTTARPMLERQSRHMPEKGLDDLLWHPEELAQNITNLVLHGLIQGECRC